MNRFYTFLRLAIVAFLWSGGLALPAFAQRPTTFDLGEVACGMTQCAGLDIPSLAAGERIVEITMRDSTLFVIGSGLSLPLAIPDGGTVPVPLCFSPPGSGAFEDSLRLIITADGVAFDTLDVALSGKGTGPNLQINPLQVVFPVTDVTSTATRQIVFRNSGTAPITMTAADLAGIVAPFQIKTSPTFPVDIAPGDSIVIEVEFSPTLPGHRSAYTDVAAGCNHTLRLTLSGQTPDLIHNGFGEVACNEVICDTLFVPSQAVNDVLLALQMRDSLSFTIGAGFVPPIAIPVSDSIGIPICFSPTRRGTIVDSVLVVVRRGGSQFDSIRVRLTGIGIGPNIDINPIVLNFPKTSPPATSTLSTFFKNTGERPLLLTAADLSISPPFRLLTPLPIEIKPGETVEIKVEFAPTEEGVFSIPVDVAVGCTRVLQVGLNGSTDFVGTGGVLRVSKVGFNPANDERVACDVSQCTEVTLSNVGNASLRIDNFGWADGSLGYFFNPVPATPLFINPNESRTLQVCINATRAGTLRDTLLVNSNDRRSIAFGMVLDASRSMILDSIPCTPLVIARLDEAKRQANLFIDNTLLYLPALSIQDQISIIHFSDDPVLSFPLTFVDNPVRAQAHAAINAINAIRGTQTGKALRNMITILQSSPLPDRVIVLLADGETSDLDKINNPVNTIINEAKSAGIRIFAVGLGLDDPVPQAYLNALTDQTNGKSFFVNDCTSLQGAFAEITEIVSQGGVWREPFQITVTAPQIVMEDIRFDTLYINDDTCVTLTLTNVGEGEAVVSDVQFTDLVGGPTSEFFLESGAVNFPIRIPENEQKTISVCFRPEQLRERAGLAKAVYNDCASQPSGGELNGTGYAEVDLRVTDERVTLPGGSVTMPIYGDSTLANYGVDTIVWTMRWNRTMLDLTGVTPGPEANGATIVQSGPIKEEGRYASVELIAAGPALQTPGVLAELQFTMLRGDSLAAYVEITAGKFEDGNPKALLKNAGIVVYDSTCFRELKPILYKGPSAKISIGSVSPTPTAGDDVAVALESTAEASLSLDLFDTDGASVLSTQHYQLPKGESVLRLNVAALRSGIYHLRLSTDDGTSLYQKLIIRR